MPIDPSVLLQSQGIRLPDPMAIAQRQLSLAELAGRRDLQKYQLDAAQRADAAARGVGDFLGNIRNINDDGEVALAIQSLPPEARKGALDVVLSQRKSMADVGKTNAEAKAKTVDVQQKAMRDISNVAQQEAANPNNLSLSRVNSVAKFYGIDLPQPPTDPRDVNGVQGYLQTLANAGYDIKDRKSNEATLRGQDMTSETSRRGQDMTAGTARRGQDMSYGTAIRGQDLMDQRARDLASITREGVSDNRINTQTQHLAKMVDSSALPNLLTSANALDDAISKYGKGDIPGVGRIAGRVPAQMLSEEGKAFRAKVQAVANDLLKLYSGGAVTANEAERRATEMMASGAFTADDLRTAWPLVKGRVNAASQNVRAGFAPEAVAAYESRGGLKLRPIGSQREAGGPAKPKLGEVRDGYLYKGGDPASQSSWEPVKQ